MGLIIKNFHLDSSCETAANKDMKPPSYDIFYLKKNQAQKKI